MGKLKRIWATIIEDDSIKERTVIYKYNLEQLAEELGMEEIHEMYTENDRLVIRVKE